MPSWLPAKDSPHPWETDALQMRRQHLHVMDKWLHTSHGAICQSFTVTCCSLWAWGLYFGSFHSLRFGFEVPMIHSPCIHRVPERWTVFSDLAGIILLEILGIEWTSKGWNNKNWSLFYRFFSSFEHPILSHGKIHGFHRNSEFSHEKWWIFP